MKDSMKLCEVTINEGGIRIRRSNPHPLTANQKFTIILSVIGAASFVFPFWALFK